MNKALYELKSLAEYREKFDVNNEEILGIGLCSRKNLCLNTKINYECNGRVLDAKCRDLTSSWKRAKAKDANDACEYYENLEQQSSTLMNLKGVYSMDDIKEYGEKNKICPYYLNRKLVKFNLNLNLVGYGKCRHIQLSLFIRP